MSDYSGSSSTSNLPAPAPLPRISPRISSASFTTVNCSKMTYLSLIADCIKFCTGRTHLGLPVLPLSSHDILDDYFLIYLTNSASHTITVVGCKSNLYLLAYRSHSIIWYFADEYINEAILRVIFNDPDKENSQYQYILVNFACSYPDLEKHAGFRFDRREFDLGIESLNSYISQCFKLTDKNLTRNEIISKAFIIYIQMISESIRLLKFNKKLSAIAQPQFGVKYSSIRPNDFDVTSQNNWGHICDRVHDSTDPKDMFLTPVMFDPAVLNSNEEYFRVIDSVPKAILLLQMLNSKRTTDDASDQGGSDQGKGKGSSSSSKVKKGKNKE